MMVPEGYRQCDSSWWLIQKSFRYMEQLKNPSWVQITTQDPNQCIRHFITIQWIGNTETITCTTQSSGVPTKGQYKQHTSYRSQWMFINRSYKKKVGPTMAQTTNNMSEPDITNTNWLLLDTCSNISSIKKMTLLKTSEPVTQAKNSDCTWAMVTKTITTLILWWCYRSRF